MIQSSESSPDLRAARLGRYGLLSASGDDACSFLHAQLTNDVEHMPPDRARLAGWCSAKGRLLASLIVLPQPDGFLLQLAADLAPAVAKRLSMFVLRAKVKISDLGRGYAQLGVWGAGAAARLRELGLSLGEAPLAIATSGALMAVRMGQDRALVVAPVAELVRLESDLAAASAAEDEWALLEIRAGRPLIRQATQDLFVPQMVNLQLLGGVDFQKGCYPGQEIVARMQFLGQLKRRMYRAHVDGEMAPHPGDELYCASSESGQGTGKVVDARPAPPGGFDLLAVVQVSLVDADDNIHLRDADGPLLRFQSMPYPFPAAEEQQPQAH